MGPSVTLTLSATIVLLFLTLPSPVFPGATVFTSAIHLPRKRTAFLVPEGGSGSYKKLEAAFSKFSTVKTVTPGSFVLKKYGEWLFDTVVVLGADAPDHIDFGEFVDAGGNVIIAAGQLSAKASKENNGLSAHLRKFAIDCGVFFSFGNIVDSFGSAGRSTTVQGTVRGAPIVYATYKGSKPVPFSGLGMALEPHNMLLMPFLSAPSTAFASDPDVKVLEEALGDNIALVVGLQSRIGSRVLFSGSVGLFADEALGPFATDVATWAAQQRGVLRYRDITHRPAASAAVVNPTTYRIGDNITYTVVVEEWREDAWLPFTPPAGDHLQVELTMVYPFVRKNLEPVARGSSFDGTYVAHIHSPDKWGVFKFVLDYRRVGYSPLVVQNITTLRPLHLDEYDRFITAAFPYYTAVFSCAAAFLLFSIAALSPKALTVKRR